jgi:RNA recognition motif-containing protein
VGDLDLAVTEAKLYEFFRSKYLSVFAAKIITCNTTKISKGYGFVKFTNQDEAQRAIAENNGASFQGKPIKVSHAYMKTKEDPREEEEDNTTKAGQMSKVYQQFYSMMNDPVLKASFENQMEKSVAGEQAGKKTFKQRLENIKALPYLQTKASETYTESLPRVVCFNLRREIESRIFMS